MTDVPQGVEMTPAQWKIVRSVLSSVVPEARVWAFGSRVAGNAKPYSDLDLAVDAHNKLDLTILATLQEAFSESDLPFKVDIVDYFSAKESFKSIIDRSRLPLLG